MNSKIMIRVWMFFILIVFMGVIIGKTSSQAPCCYYPNHETNAVDGNGADYSVPSATKFNVTISNDQGTVFDGRMVREYSTGPGTNGCYYQGAPYDEHPIISGGTWTVAGGQVAGQTNHWGWDFVGWTPRGVTAVRSAAANGNIQLPCGEHVNQGVEINQCPSGDPTTGDWYAYNTTNILSQTVYSTFVINCRVSVCHSIDY